MIFKLLKDLFFHRAGKGRKWGPRGGRTGRANARQTYPRTRGRSWRTSCWSTSKWRLWMMTSSKVCRKTSIFVEEFFIENDVFVEWRPPSGGSWLERTFFEKYAAQVFASTLERQSLGGETRGEGCGEQDRLEAVYSPSVLINTRQSRKTRQN